MPRSLAETRPASLATAWPIAAAVVLAVLLTLGPAHARETPRAGVFDSFVLSLSWSPTYCETSEGEDDRQQCAPGKRFAFVVHGLWPQYTRGWPEYCAGREQWVPDPIIDGMLDVMPSKSLIIHEWKKHGSCSGVSVADYFRATRLLFERVRIPARYLSPGAPVVTTPDQLVTDYWPASNFSTRPTSLACTRFVPRS